MREWSAKKSLLVYRVVMIFFVFAGLSLPLQLWGTVGLSRVHAPYRHFGLSLATEVAIASGLAILACATAISMWKKHRSAAYLGTLYFAITWAHQLAESILTYPTKRVFPGPRMLCIAMPIIGLAVLCIFGWYFLWEYPKAIQGKEAGPSL